jgi:signal peptidase
MHTIHDTWTEFTTMNHRRRGHQLVNLLLVISTALMTWKFFMVASWSESPIVVVLSGSMEPAYYRGDILFLELTDNPLITVGDVVVYKLDERNIPIVHRIISVHQEGDEYYMLTKGDNNRVNDRGLYAQGQMWVQRKDLMGRVWFYIPYVGIITIWLNDYPPLKYAVIGFMVIVGLTTREPQG